MLTYDDIPQRFNLAAYFLDRNLEEGRGDRVALYCGERACTYAELCALTNQAGHVLRELGVEVEERVLLACADSIEFVAIWWAAIKIGAVVAELYQFLPAKDFEYYLNYSRARLIVTDSSTRDRVNQVHDSSPWLRCSLVVGPYEGLLRNSEVSFDALVGEAPRELSCADTSRDDVTLWKFTTGSTGQPKAAVHLMHDPLICYWSYALEVLELSADDLVLPVPKLFFGYARDMTALFTFGVGAAGIIFPERSTPERLFELIARHRPTIMLQVPTMINAMAEHPDASHQDLSCLRLCTSGGEALPVEVYEKWMRTFGVELCDGIGSAEMYYMYVANRPGAVRPGSVGQVVPGYQVDIMDEQDRSLPDGEMGELTVVGESAAVMYWNDHAKSKRTIAGDRIRTGDLFVRDPDGYFWYRGRADDLFKVSGIWVAPVEVEACLLEHPAVLETCVVGHEADGLILPRAHVVLRPGFTPSESLEQELKEHVRTRLSPHKYPRSVRFASALPKTPNGKVDRKALKAAGVGRGQQGSQ